MNITEEHTALISSPWRWRQYVILKHLYPHARLYGVRPKKTTEWISTVLKTANSNTLLFLGSLVFQWICCLRFAAHQKFMAAWQMDHCKACQYQG